MLDIKILFRNHFLSDIKDKGNRNTFQYPEITKQYAT